MLTIDIKEAEVNFEKYVKLLEDKKEKEIIISINGNPTIVLLPYTKYKSPIDIEGFRMSEEQLQAKLESGYDDYKLGKTKDAKKALLDLRAKLKADYKESIKTKS